MGKELNTKELRERIDKWKKDFLEYGIYPAAIRIGQTDDPVERMIWVAAVLELQAEGKMLL